MEQKSIDQMTMIILRLVGVITIFIGLIMTTETIIQLIAAQSMMSGFPEGLPRGMNVNIRGPAGRIGSWAIASQVAVIVWGAILAALARPIAQGITKE